MGNWKTQESRLYETTWIHLCRELQELGKACPVLISELESQWKLKYLLASSPKHEAMSTYTLCINFVPLSLHSCINILYITACRKKRK